MAKKNNNVYMSNDLDRQQAEIRKAKGNPNKNVHHKKNNSNYQGYVAGKKSAEAARAKEYAQQQRQPVWVTVTMVVIFVVLIAMLVLMNGVMKDSAIFAQIATLVIGVSCGILFYLRRFSKQPDNKFQKVLSIVLAVMAVVYTFMGAYGLLKLL